MTNAFLVTGGASAIGRAIALRLACEGANICVLSLNRERVSLLPSELKYFASSTDLTETKKAIEALGSQCFTIEGDVSSTSDVGRTVSAIVEAFLGVSIS